MNKTGFVGAGLMGHGMAKNLVEKGWPLTVLGHRNRQPVEDLVKRGAKQAKDVADLMANAELVFVCVTGSPQVEDLIYRKGGILDSSRSGQIVVDTSTSQPLSTLKIAADLKAKGVRFVDAPLTRTPVEAEQGRLNTMVGADPVTFEEIKPALAAFCENIFHVGDLGAGHKLKLINNFAAIGRMSLIAEALTACAKLGVDPKKYVALVSQGAANPGIFQMLAGKAATMQTLLSAVNLDFGGPEHPVASLVQAQAKLNAVEFPSK